MNLSQKDSSFQQIPLDIKTLELGVETKGRLSFMDKAILFVEYMQLISQIIFQNSTFTHSKSPGLLYNSVLYILKIFNPCSLIPTETRNLLLISLFIVIVCFLAVKILLLGYIAFIAYTGREGHRWFVALWRWILKIDGRCCSFFIASFCLNVIQAFHEGNSHVKSLNYSMIISLTVLVNLLQNAFVVLIWVRYSYILPSKQLLSAKNNTIELITLVQKVVLLILQVTLEASPTASVWIVAVINLAFDVLRSGYFLRNIPPYKMLTLKLMAVTLMIIASLNIAYLIVAITNTKQYSPNNMPYALIIWLLFAPIIVKMFWAWTENLVKTILSKFSETDSIAILLQKIEAIRQIRQDSRKMNKFNQSAQFEHFMQSSIVANLSEIFGIESTEENILENRACANKMFARYLEKIHGMYPKNKLIQLYLTFYYGKKLKLYGIAVKLLAGLEKTNSFSIKSNALLLKLEIQQKISNEYKNKENKLNLMEYHQHNGEYLRVKAKILEQAALQIELCKETGEISADLGKILNLGQMIEKQRKFIHKKMKVLQEEFPQYFYEPSLVFAYYELALNHSARDFAKYSQKALTNHKKYEVRFRSKKLGQENLYENNKMLFKLNIQKDTFGTIEECTRSVKPCLGWEAKFLYGNSILNVVAPSLKAYYTSGVNRFKGTGDRKILNQLSRTFAYHKNKYLVQVESYLNIHPSLKQGVYLDLVMRPLIDEKEYIFVDKDGMINSFTEKIGKKLNLFNAVQGGGVKVRVLSGDLDDMDMIYERVFSLYQPKNTELFESESPTEKTLKEPETQRIPFLDQNQSPRQRARRSVYRYLNLRNKQNVEMLDLYKFYCQEGKKVVLTPVGTEGQQDYTFKCKLDNQYYENFQLKLFVFEEIFEDSGSKMKEFEEQREKHLTQSSDEKNTEEMTSGALQTKNQEVIITKEDYAMITSPKETENPLMRPKDTMPEILLSPKCFSTDALPLVHAPSQADDDDFNDDEKQELEHNVDGYVSSLQLQDKKESHPISHDKKKEIIKRLRTEDQRKFLIAAEESVGSQRTRNSGQERVARSVKEALNTRFRPKLYLGFIAVFYLLLVLIFMNQFVIQLIYKTNLTNVKARKEVLRNSELRNVLIVKIQRNLRYIWDFSEGRLGTTGLSSSALPLPVRVRTTKSDLAILSNLNEELMKNTDVLTDGDRQELFARNVEVYYVDNTSTTDSSSIRLTGFQAIESVVEAGLEGISLYNLNMTTQAFDVFNFIFRNALNDFFIKSEETSEIFLKSSENDKQRTITLFSTSLIITLVLLVLLTLGSVILILLQYHREKKLMKSFVKMDPAGLVQVLKRLEDFTRIIQENVTLDVLGKIKPYEFSRGFGSQNVNNKKLNKEKDFKKPNHQQILMRYLLHIPLLLVPVLVIGGLFTWGSLYYRKEMEYCQNTLNQIYYVDKIKLNSNLAATICGELLSQNDTTFLRNKPLTSELVNQIEVFDGIAQNTMTVLENEQGGYSPLIQTILFEDNCHLFNASFKAICLNAGAGWGTVTLLNIIKSVQLTMETIEDSYTTSDKSQSVLNSLQILGFNKILIPNAVTGELCSMIDNQLNLEFDEKIQVAKKRNQNLMVVVWVLLIVFSRAFWDLTFRKILDADLKFKRVLKVMPPRLILGNFLLKAYLLRTSHGALNSIRHEM